MTAPTMTSAQLARRTRSLMSKLGIVTSHLNDVQVCELLDAPATPAQPSKRKAALPEKPFQQIPGTEIHFVQDPRTKEPGELRLTHYQPAKTTKGSGKYFGRLRGCQVELSGSQMLNLLDGANVGAYWPSGPIGGKVLVIALDPRA